MKSYVSVVVVVAMFLAPCASAAVTARALELKPGDAVVTVKDDDGSPLANAEVELQTKAGEVVNAFKADKNGKCTVTGLKPGAYRLKVANRAYLPFAVNTKASHQSVLVMLPAKGRYAAGSPTKAAGLPTLVTYIIGGIIVGAIFISAWGHNGGSSGSGSSCHP